MIFNKNILVFLYLYLVTFCFLFGLRFNLIVVNIVVYVPLIIYGVLYVLGIRKSRKYNYYWNCFLLMVLVYFIVVMMIVNSSISLPFQAIFNIALTLGFYNVCCKVYKSDVIYKISKMFFVATLIQSFCVYLTKIFPYLNELPFIMLQKLGNMNVDQVISVNVRVFGFSNGGGDGLGFSLSMGLCFSLYFSILMLNKHRSYLKQTIMLSSVLFIISSNLFVSRTNLVASILLLVLFVVMLLWGKKYKEIMSLLVICVLAVNLIVLSHVNLWWALESYYSYVNTGDIDRGSLNVLLNKMIFLPSDTFTLLFGLSPVSGTDIGYVRYLFNTGIVFSFILYVSIVFTYIRCMLVSSSIEIKYLLFILLFCTLLFQAKVAFITVGLALKIIVLVVLLFNRHDLKNCSGVHI